jgi:hypothetical protein
MASRACDAAALLVPSNCNSQGMVQLRPSPIRSLRQSASPFPSAPAARWVLRLADRSATGSCGCSPPAPVLRRGGDKGVPRSSGRRVEQLRPGAPDEDAASSSAEDARRVRNRGGASLACRIRSSICKRFRLAAVLLIRRDAVRPKAPAPPPGEERESSPVAGGNRGVGGWTRKRQKFLRQKRPKVGARNLPFAAQMDSPPASVRRSARLPEERCQPPARSSRRRRRRRPRLVRRRQLAAG